ncbi:MAG: macro domain-containing protein, partial [Coriobacteriales bacterium]|nr:macro domain-containing protein [Coriobacteriales bacterium]
MLGCWVPGHHCIDNAIHTFAGVRLRAECASIMSAQGHEEPTGMAKITSAYNLPACHVIHTVGPIAGGFPTARHRAQLASCYHSCLDLAEKSGLSSIAFCCISTGIFGFPQDEAAAIAVRTVRSWFAEHNSNMTVVFNVFSAYDEQLYSELLFS